MKIKTIVCSLILAGTVALSSTAAYSAGSPITVEGDTLEYDAASGIVKANGNVVLSQAEAVMNSAAAEYNLNTREAYLSGGVTAQQRDMTMSSAELRSYDNVRLVATGAVVLTKGGDRVSGSQVDYNTDTQYAIVTGGAHLTTSDAVMTADSVDAYLAEDRAIGHNNVHFVSEARQADATADQADYYGPKNGKTRVILTGNAYAVQDGNTFTGSMLTLYLDDKVADAEGRAKLVIQPQ